MKANQTTQLATDSISSNSARCCRCGETLDAYELEHKDCVLCFLDRENHFNDFVQETRGWFREILNAMGGTAGADRLGDPSPWRENAVRALEEGLSAVR